MDFLTFRRKQNALTKVHIAKDLLGQAWPELIGGQPEYRKLAYDVQRVIEKLEDAGRKAVEATRG